MEFLFGRRKTPAEMLRQVGNKKADGKITKTTRWAFPINRIGVGRLSLCL